MFHSSLYTITLHSEESLYNHIEQDFIYRGFSDLTQQSQIHTQVKSLVDWVRDLRSLSRDYLTVHVNGFHQAMVFHIRQTAVHIWCIGRALSREKDW